MPSHSRCLGPWPPVFEGSPANPHFTDREMEAQIRVDTSLRPCSQLEGRKYNILPLAVAQSYGSLKMAPVSQSWGVGMRVWSRAPAHWDA